jgi:microcin C transport system substrate-binding protein
MIPRKLLAAFLLSLSLAHPAFAQEWVSAHAIAMHGAPKHAAGFTHFDYVNPAAPKGGSLRLNITGTFDSLNPFIVKGAAAEGTTYIYESLRTDRS